MSTSITLITAAFVAGAIQIPCAAADFTVSLRDAVLQVRAAAPCPPLLAEPLADETAAIVNESIAKYLDRNARVVPVADPLPLLEDLGLNVERAKLVRGAGRSEADAIKSALIIGFRDLPDCAYSRFGTATLSNDNRGGWYLTTVVLVGD